MSTRRTYTPQEKERLINLVNQNGMSTRAAAIELGIPPSTAQNWVKKEEAQIYSHAAATAAAAAGNNLFQQPASPVYSNNFTPPSPSPSPPPQQQQVPSLFSSPMNATKTYKTYTPQDKENLFHLVRDRGMTTRAAAAQLGINESTAYSWVSKEKEARQNEPVKAETNPFKAFMAGYPSPSPTPAPQNPNSQAPGNLFSPASANTKTNKTYTPQDKENLFHLIRDKGINTHAAAVQLGIHPSTAQTWVSKEKDAQDSQLAKLLKKPAHPTGHASESEDDDKISQKPSASSRMNSTKTYKSYTSQDKINLIHLVRDKGMSTRAAAMQLGINESTAYAWMSKEKGSDGQLPKPSAVVDDEPVDMNKELPMPPPTQESPTRTYKKYTPQDKETLFHLIRDKGMTTRTAAAQAGINESTAYSWVKKERDTARELGLTSLLEKQADNSQHASNVFDSSGSEPSSSSSSSEKAVTPTEQPVRTSPDVKSGRTYKTYTHQHKEDLFHLVKDKGMSTRGAALELGINPSTAYFWIKKDRRDQQAEDAASTVASSEIHKKADPLSDQPSSQLETPPQPENNSDQDVSGGKTTKRTYKSYTAQDKENLLQLVKDKGMSTRAAALQLGINPSTAQGWVKKDREKPVAAVEPTLTAEQEVFLTRLIDEQGVLTLDEMLETLNAEFKGLDISKTALCNYAMQKYTICFTL
ncbi:hypothetical protein BD770DRAFT_376759 [Pilaira anomala]|nr:hypothetical protein BD770DRAFT_376759 [Pilaira anomala]